MKVVAERSRGDVSSCTTANKRPWISDLELWRSKRWMTSVRSGALKVVGHGFQIWSFRGQSDGWRRPDLEPWRSLAMDFRYGALEVKAMDGADGDDVFHASVEEGWRRLSAVMIMRSIEAVRKPESMCLKSYAMFLWSLP
nr:hypothetical protein Iba_chr12cCG5790 [Ipomoea batatas]